MHELIKESLFQLTSTRDVVGNLCCKLRKLQKVLWQWKNRYRNQIREYKNVILKEVEDLEKFEEIRWLDLEKTVKLLSLCKKIKEVYRNEEIM